MKTTKNECPKCSRNLLWNWGEDYLAYADGSPVNTVEMQTSKIDDLKYEVTVYVCKCGQILSAYILDPEKGSSVVSIKQLQNVDWKKFSVEN